MSIGNIVAEMLVLQSLTLSPDPLRWALSPPRVPSSRNAAYRGEQRDKRVQDGLLASFQVLQNSRVLVCLDSRAKKPPRWLRKKNFKLTDMQLPGAPEGCTYVVYAKLYREGDEASV